MCHGILNINHLQLLPEWRAAQSSSEAGEDYHAVNNTNTRGSPMEALLPLVVFLMQIFLFHLLIQEKQKGRWGEVWG